MAGATAVIQRIHQDWRIIGYYVFSFAAGGLVKPYLNLYLVEVGLNGIQIGLIQGWTAFVIVLLAPIMGDLADKTQRHRLLLGSTTFLKGIAAPLLLVNTSFVWLAGMISVRLLASQMQDAIMNRLTLAHLQAHGRTGFGAVRFWGALSFAATSIWAGWMAQDSSVSILFPVSALFSLVALIFVTGFPAQMAPLRSAKPSATPSSSAGSVQLRILWVVIFIFSLGWSGMQTFGNVYLVDALGADYVLIGLLSAVTGLAPIFTFHLADRLTSWRGAVNTLAVSLLMFALAWFGFSLLKRPSTALPLVALMGGAQAVFLVAIVSLLGAFGLPERAATDQMLAQLTIPGLAGIIAQPVSGVIYDKVGGANLFMLDAVLVSAALVLLIGQRHQFIHSS